MKIILNGAGGRMGAEVRRLLESGVGGAELVCAVDASGADGMLPSLSEYTGEADLIIDFSHRSATAELTEYAVSRGLPVVIATTGQSESELAMIQRAASSVPILFSANMSIGIAALIRAAKAVLAVYPDADIEIVETHHNRKLDAPSGTALMVARSLSELRPDSSFQYGRGGQKKREKREIGIHAVRMGNVVGTHEILIGTDTETITLKHEAHSRALFADGAIAAAAFLLTRPAGLYAMSDLVES